MEQGEVPEQNQTTRLLVETEQEGNLHNVVNNVFFTGKDITLGRSNPKGSVSYYRLSNLSRTVSIEVFMRKGGKLENVSLPNRILHRIATYLREKPRGNGRFDCVSFVHYVNDIPYYSPFFNKDRWDISKMEDTEKLKPGDTILISTNEGSYKHAAIYLSNNLFISKFGNKGGLIVADINEMKKGFGGDSVYLAKPKEVAAFEEEIY